ncbi:hypothetical protein RM53_08990 [Brevundimonas nasdae]|uniref:Uncharacterized protein n=1 Tax=Brevundimonas nasdae TaxID=172043 RepID=A0A0B4D137_9CAUL|nr:hypothetical protein RM53_08990 [Brevundimonas nasdae]
MSTWTILRVATPDMQPAYQDENKKKTFVQGDAAWTTGPVIDSTICCSGPLPGHAGASGQNLARKQQAASHHRSREVTLK